MTKRSSFRFCAALVGAIATLSGCSGAPGASDETLPPSTESIIGGEPTDARKYDAVGALAWVYPGYGVIHVFCSGTLIDEQAIVTARHCTPSIEEAFEYGITPAFVFGPDAWSPEQIVPITGYVAAPPSPSGAGLLLDGGRDVAVAYLESEPADIKPIKVAKFKHNMVDDRFKIVGYGVSSPDEHITGLKYAGKVTGRAISGKWYKLLFDNDYRAYYDWYWTDSAAAAPSAEEVKEWWKIYKLESGYELLAGGTRGDAIGCFGDSGGPLLARDDRDKLRIYGVSFATEATISTTCGLGGAYLVFNNEMLDFVKDALE